MKNGVKMIDIANKLGVSVVTVSNALAGRDGVSDKMRALICDTAKEMGYRPSNNNATKKPETQGKSVGIITSERFVGSMGTFYWELTAGISNRLSDLNILTVYECVTRENERKAVLPKIALEHKADGIIVIGQLKRSYIAELSRTDIPLLFVDFYDGRYNIDSVNSDSYQGGYILTDYLIQNGHRNIGFIGNLNVTSSINDRFFGYLKCLIENNITYRPEWRLDDRDDTGILFDRLDFPENMPTAFVCNSDETAFRVISALRSKDVRIPDDISIVGYDNYTVSDICIPAITTVEVDINKMASSAVEIMEKKLADSSYSAGRCIIGGKLIEKDSVLDIRRKL
ncbi:MAG: LacI family DNA-binding transcriptional regulator [Ruminococcus flavefaciens]|nr:LacI family DNA-binding transcriptional regulator [Ruminococcus flavefaciens]MCM1230350.1 LacI family DNA-binding transcriptional regulator [Ruminococcus flavefaciens]